MESKKTMQSYGMLDIAKFGCALLILLYHYFSERGSLPSPLDEALSLYAVAVAFFMICSGFLTWRKLLATAPDARWQLVWKQGKRIAAIYLLWSVPYLIFSIARWDWSQVTLPFVLGKIQGWIFQSTFSTIWFMPSLAIGTVLSFWVTEKLPKTVAYGLAVVCYVGSMLFGSYTFVGSSSDAFAAVKDFIGTWLGGSRGWLLYGFPLVTLGRLAASCQISQAKPVRNAVLCVGSMTLLLAEALLLRRLAHAHTGIDTTAMMPMVVWCVLQFCISIPMDAGKTGKWMRSMSVLIFMTQRLFLSVLTALCPGLDEIKGTKIEFWILCGGTMAFSAGVIALSKYWKPLRKLY